MKGFALLVACGGFLLAGCGGGSDAGANAPPEGGTNADQQAARPANADDPDRPKTTIVRSLIDAIDAADAEDDDTKDDLRQILRESDEELSQVLGDNPRLAIERANQKPPVLVIGQPRQLPGNGN